MAPPGETQFAEGPAQGRGYRSTTTALPVVQDGTIKYEIKLTGELSTNPLSFGEESPEYGTLVMEGVNAQHHQHMFCARLDMAVDDQEGGKGLYVSEVTCRAVVTCAVPCCAVLRCAVLYSATLCHAVLPCAGLCHAMLSLQLPNRLRATVCLIKCSCKQTTFKAYAVLPCMLSCWSEQQAYVSSKHTVSQHL